MARDADDPHPDKSGPRRSERLRAGAAALSNALVHAPENAAYGLLAFAPLGAAFGPAAMAFALLGTVVSNVVGSAFGGGRIVAGPRASLALLTAGFVAALIEMLGERGLASPAQVLALCAVAVMASGALQVGFGLLRLGSIVKYTPHPVRVGVTSGVGLLLVVTALPVATGHGFGSDWRSAFEAPPLGAVVIGAVALSLTALAGRFQERVPPVLIGLVGAALLHVALARWWPSATLGGLIGEPALPRDGLLAFDPRRLWSGELFDAPLLALLASYAVTVAVLCSLDTLLGVSVIDGRLRRSRDANRELGCQGWANVAAGLAAGQALSPSIPRSLPLVVPHPNVRHLVLVYAMSMLLLLVFAPRLIGQVPSSAIGGVLLLQGLQMVAPAFWRSPLVLWRLHRERRSQAQGGIHAPHPRAGDWAIEVGVALSAVALGLGPAIVIGAALAVLLFVRSNMRDVVRQEWSAETRRSLKARPSSVADALVASGGRIRLLELEGSLFFGTADGLRARLEELETIADTAILDLRQITDVDVTAARILAETAEHWARAGKQLVFTELPAGDPRRRLIESAGSATGAPCFIDHTDLAMEYAEDRLLDRLKPAAEVDKTFTLADTMLGRGLNGDELELLSGRMQRMHIREGQVLFRVGDQGDGLYLSVKGDIGLRVPGSARRLASFAPGVVIGEMATLTRGTRSAEAFAESDVDVLKLSVDDFEHLVAEHPVLAAKLLKNISLHLADRIRTLTTDLSHWVSRAAAGGNAPHAGGLPTLRPESPATDG